MSLASLWNFVILPSKRERTPETAPAVPATLVEPRRRRAPGPFAPERNAGDRIALARHEVDTAEEPGLNQSVAHARAALRDRRMELAALGPPPEPPGSMLLAGLLGALAIALTLALSIHDLVFARVLGGQVAPLIAAFVASTILASALVFGLLQASGTHPSWEVDTESGSLVPTRSFRDWKWTAVGLAFGAALYCMRASALVTVQERWLAVGLALYEVVAITVLELYAGSWRAAQAQFLERDGTYSAAQAQVQVADTWLVGREVLLRACRASIEAFQREVEDRDAEPRLVPDSSKKDPAPSPGRGQSPAPPAAPAHPTVVPSTTEDEVIWHAAPAQSRLFARVPGRPTHLEPDGRGEQ